MDQVKFFFDPLCPWCYLTSKWARRLEELGEVDLDWGVFSLEIVNIEQGKDPRELDARSGASLRTAIAVRDAEGGKAVGRLYAAIGDRVWDRPVPEPHGPDTVRDALSEIGLDPGLCDKALADPATWDAVVEEHRALIDRTRSFGVPTILLDGGSGPAIFGPVISRVPSDEDAVELWHHVRWLARYDNFSELKRDRTQRPVLDAEPWYREQREKARAARG